VLGAETSTAASCRATALTVRLAVAVAVTVATVAVSESARVTELRPSASVVAAVAVAGEVAVAVVVVVTELPAEVAAIIVSRRPNPDCANVSGITAVTIAPLLASLSAVVRRPLAPPAAAEAAAFGASVSARVGCLLRLRRLCAPPESPLCPAPLLSAIDAGLWWRRWCAPELLRRLLCRFRGAPPLLGTRLNTRLLLRMCLLFGLSARVPVMTISPVVATAASQLSAAQSPSRSESPLRTSPAMTTKLLPFAVLPPGLTWSESV